MLVLETKKYENQIQFLTAERDMILQAQMQADNSKYTPDIQLMNFESADEKRQQLESHLKEINQEWVTISDKIQEQTS